MDIRPARQNDTPALQNLYDEAIPDNEGGMVGRLAVSLLSEKTNPTTESLVMDDAGVVKGHIAFSPVSITGHEDVRAYILSPLAVRIDCQGQGIGSALIDYGKRLLSKDGAHIILVYGDPAYYGRFGFDAEAASRFIPPYPLGYPFGWQTLELNRCEIRGDTVEIECVASLNNAAYW